MNRSLGTYQGRILVVPHPGKRPGPDHVAVAMRRLLVAAHAVMIVSARRGYRSGPDLTSVRLPPPETDPEQRGAISRMLRLQSQGRQVLRTRPGRSTFRH